MMSLLCLYQKSTKYKIKRNYIYILKIAIFSDKFIRLEYCQVEKNLVLLTQKKEITL